VLATATATVSLRLSLATSARLAAMSLLTVTITVVCAATTVAVTVAVAVAIMITMVARLLLLLRRLRLEVLVDADRHGPRSVQGNETVWLDGSDSVRRVAMPALPAAAAHVARVRHSRGFADSLRVHSQRRVTVDVGVHRLSRCYRLRLRRRVRVLVVGSSAHVPHRQPDEQQTAARHPRREQAASHSHVCTVVCEGAEAREERRDGQDHSRVPRAFVHNLPHLHTLHTHTPQRTLTPGDDGLPRRCLSSGMQQQLHREHEACGVETHSTRHRPRVRMRSNQRVQRLRDPHDHHHEAQNLVCLLEVTVARLALHHHDRDDERCDADGETDALDDAMVLEPERRRR
jgi:hypothetical protein